MSSNSSQFQLKTLFFSTLIFQLVNSNSLKSTHHTTKLDESLTYIWPLPSKFTSGNDTLTVDPNLTLEFTGYTGSGSVVIEEAFERYKKIIFKHGSNKLSKTGDYFDVSKVTVIVHSDNHELQLGVDESYSLLVSKSNEHSIIGEVSIEVKLQLSNVINIDTMSQLCTFDYGVKTVQIHKAPWFIQDKPRFAYRGLMLDTSRHYLPIEIIKQIIESMSYAKLNVLHWHIIDEQSFPLEVPSYPNLWKGAYTKWERYTVEDAIEIVDFAKMRGINVMAEVDVPGHAESWGAGYPDLWPSPSCKEPLDVSKNYTFDVITGILSDMRKIFPFELFHLGGDEVNTSCWTTTPHIKQWLQDNNMTSKDAYQYFVLRAQEIAISRNWTPVNWEETFNTFPSKLNPRTVVHNWLGGGVCPKAVASGFRCIYSNQGFWYLDHLDVPWEEVYYAEPLEGIKSISEQKLVLGGEVCMWGETADASDVQQTIWPRAAAAAERLWSDKEATSSTNTTSAALQRLEYFRCLLTRRGVPAAPVTNFYARRPPLRPGSCYEQ
ncbi:beta-hexosaminidase 1 isoform X2 [Lycium ferocissimum]|uniref:beta-hexosaminidase 1 isoform X2 n=1 Tax=Lycium ferocissimum TaxID=112874 RepID=UPI002815FF5B|nr:beta-hexosaminidase 1 isoform X2 [Lycium ferocissimum]